MTPTELYLHAASDLRLQHPPGCPYRCSVPSKMPETPTVDFRYPIGRFRTLQHPDVDTREQSRADISVLPSQLVAAVAGLVDSQLDTPYRAGGWTVRQVVHHLADSHMNGLVRLKLALTEDAPTIKSYEEALWAELPDTRLPIESSLKIIDGVHARMDAVLGALSDADFQRKFTRADGGQDTLETWIRLYGWHGRHHLAHITELKRRKGW